MTPSRDALAWLHVRLGAPGAGRSGLLRLPLGSARTTELCMAIEHDPDAVDWVLRATHGAYG